MTRNEDFDNLTVGTIIDKSSSNTHDPDDIGSGGGGGSATAIQSSEPSSPSTGDDWLDTSTARYR